jgi:nitrogen-specific signal transduction histidine kinase
MMIAIQVFSFLLAIITGFFALEVGSIELNKSLRSTPFYTFKDSIQQFFPGASRKGRPALGEEQIPATQVKTALNKMRLTVLICGFVAFFSGIVLNYAIRSTLKRLARSLRSVGRGDFTENLDLYSQEELGHVVRAYNRMVSSLNRYMLETSAGATFTLNSDGIIMSFNPMAEIMFHRDYRDALGGHFTDVFPVTKKNRGLVDIIMRGLEKGEPSSRKDLVIETSEGEKTARKLTTSILSGDTGKLVEVLASFGDFEEVKEIQNQMERMNRLASLGSLVAGLAHEIRTPLGSLRGFTQLLGEDLPKEDKKRQYTEIILKEIDRLNRVVEELLSFAQPTAAEFEARDVNEIVRDALLLVQASFSGKAVQVKERYDPDLPKVMAERSRLVQAMLNIIANAYEATPDQGCIIVETRKGREGTLGTAPETATLPRSVIIDFTNTGRGISFEDAKRMFDPFFTTKEKGTGLGLAIAQQVATAHGGTLTVINRGETDLQEGVTLRMELPAEGRVDWIVSESLGPS